MCCVFIKPFLISDSDLMGICTIQWNDWLIDDWWCCRPLAHLFGHAHQGAESQVIDSVLFSNASMRLGDCRPDCSQHKQSAVIDVYLPNKSTQLHSDSSHTFCSMNWTVTDIHPPDHWLPRTFMILPPYIRHDKAKWNTTVIFSYLTLNRIVLPLGSSRFMSKFLNTRKIKVNMVYILWYTDLGSLEWVESYLL